MPEIERYLGLPASINCGTIPQIWTNYKLTRAADPTRHEPSVITITVCIHFLTCQYKIKNFIVGYPSIINAEER
jgi:hypothetical protein